MKLKPIVHTALTLAVLFAPALALAATIVGGVSGSGSFLGISFGNGNLPIGCSSTICGIGNTIIYIINSILVPVLFAVAFIVFLYGIARAYIFSYGDTTKVAEGHKLVLWGLVAFAVMISIWGLVNIVANTFGLSGAYAPTPPTSY